MRKSIKKSLALLLSVLMLMSVVPATVSLAATYGSFTYQVEGETVKLLKYNGTATMVVIPDEIEEKPVATIGGEAFRSKKVVDVAFGENVKTVGQYAFAYCTALETVYISDSVKSINNYAFLNCSKLTNIYYEGSVEEWAAITIATGNAVLTADKITFNYCRHDLVKTEAVEAECEKPGNIEYWTCSKCEKIYSDEAATNLITEEQTITSEKGHEIAITIPGGINVVTPPTCTEDGVASQYCNRCKQNVNVTLGATGHNRVIMSAVEATCESDGLTQGEKCDKCDEIFVKQEVIPKKGHEITITFPGGINVVTPPTCTETGIASQYCNRCKQNVNVTLGEKGHTAGEAVRENVKAADCVNAGSYDSVVYCSDCNVELNRKSETINPIGHTPKIVPAVDATCEATGLTEGEVCETCGEVLLAQQEVPAKGHEITITFPGGLNVVVPATCTQTGIASQYCSRCQKNVNVTLGELGHNHVTVPAVAPTCLETGLTEGEKCDRCDVVFVEQQVVPATGHNYIEDTTQSYGPTCDNSGLFIGTCACGVGKTEPINPLGHDLEYVDAKAADCENIGWDEYVICKREGCGYTTYEEIPAKNHTPGAEADCVNDQICTVCNKVLKESSGHRIDVLEAVDATCEATGLTEGEVCTVCEAVIIPQEELPELGHNYEKIADKSYDATCDKPGLNYEKCSRCGDVIADPIDSLGHDIEKVNAKEPDCENIGWLAYEKCKVCTYTTYEEISAKGHTPGAEATCVSDQICTVCNEVIEERFGHTTEELEAVDATCTTPGKTEGLWCTVCETILVPQNIVPATGHETQKLEAKAPTCTETGLTEGLKCTKCNEIIYAQEVLPATGHTEATIEAKEATCDATGNTEGVICEVCKVWLKESIVIPALEHMLIDLAPVAATCTETGLTAGKKCNRIACDFEVAQTVIPAKGHTTEVIPAVDPTCTEVGYTAGAKCSVCNVVTVQPTEISALGHKAGPAATCTEAQLCTVCDVVMAAANGHTPGEDATCTADQICTVCEDVITEALGHNYEVTESTVTCIADGVVKYDCSRCDANYEENVKATGHDVRSWTTITFATCKADGLKAGTCMNCKYTIQDVILKVDHKDENNDKKCDFCGTSLGSTILPEEEEKEDDKTTEDSDECTCLCHAVGIKGLIYDFILFLQRLFGLNRTCKCGEAHY